MPGQKGRDRFRSCAVTQMDRKGAQKQHARPLPKGARGAVAAQKRRQERAETGSTLPKPFSQPLIYPIKR